MFYVLAKPKAKSTIDAVSAIGTPHTFLRRHKLLLSLDVLKIIGRQLGKCADLKLRLHVLTMAAHGLGGNTESIGNLLCLAALGNQFHNLDFSIRKLGVQLRLAYHTLIPTLATQRATHFLEMKEPISIDIGRMSIVFPKVASAKARDYVELVQHSVQLINGI